MKIKQSASLTINLYEDGTSEYVIMSHPDGNDIEEKLKSVIGLMNAMVKAKIEERPKRRRTQ